MSPLEHGEVFVLDDGGEVDLDLGTLLKTVGKFLPLSKSRELRTIPANLSEPREQHNDRENI